MGTFRVYYKAGWPKKKRQWFDAEFASRRKAKNFCRNRLFSYEGLTIVHPDGTEEMYVMPDQKNERQSWFVNYYSCMECGEEWQDEGDCRCNDRCPKCNAETEPYGSDDVSDEAGAL